MLTSINVKDFRKNEKPNHEKLGRINIIFYSGNIGLNHILNVSSTSKIKVHFFYVL